MAQACRALARECQQLVRQEGEKAVGLGFLDEAAEQFRSAVSIFSSQPLPGGCLPASSRQQCA
jgi:hypothetical protein